MCKNEEYKFLRQEALESRKFVFERPLIITTAVLAAILATKDTKYLEYFSIPFLSLLLFNLWFSFNRTASIARIYAYIQLIHELEKYEWVGWETDLRNYRIASAKTAQKRSFCEPLKQLWKKPNQEEIDQEEFKQYDSTSYYEKIFYFHIILAVFLVFLMVLRSEIIPTSSIYGLIILVLNIFLLAGFIIISTAYFSPKNTTMFIEQKRRFWKDEIFKYEKAYRQNGLVTPQSNLTSGT